MTETIDSKQNNCTLVAVREVTRFSDSEILTGFRKHGYRDDKGMSNYAWINAAKSLGLEIESIGIEYESKSSAYIDRYGAERLRYNVKSLTLGQFIREFSVGVYFVSVSGHALVIRDGKIVDHNHRRSFGVRRQVKFAHKVLNAPVIEQSKLSKFLMFPKVMAKPRGKTASYSRYVDAWLYVSKNGNVTAKQLLEHTQYTKADLRHDLKKGLITYKPQQENI